MKPLYRTLLITILLTSLPAAVSAQQAAVSNPPVTAQKVNFALPIPGPLAMAAAAPAPSIPGNMTPVNRRSSVPMKQYGYSRIDWELGRAWLGTLIGFAYAYIGDLIIHYDFDFSKANWLLNEGQDDVLEKPVKRGEVVYNVLLYGGLPPYFAMQGIRSINITRKNSLGSYILGTIGSLAGLIYWTNTGELYSLKGVAAYTGLTALFSNIGYHIF